MEELDKKEKSIMEELKIQYEMNLTSEQKNALITYNSSLFIFYNYITSINGYQEMSAEKLCEICKSFFTKNRRYIKNLTLFMNDKENDDEELRTALSTIFDDKVMWFDNVVDMYRNPISAKLMYEVSKDFEYSLKTQILSEFISTSLIERAAMKYIINGQGDNSALFRIKLPKSTPVCIFPKTVKNDGLFGYKLMLIDDANIHEIMIDTSKVKEILECKDIKKDNEELSL